MSYIDKIKSATGVDRSLARVSNIVGGSSLLPASVKSALEKAKGASDGVTDGVGTAAGAAAGAVIGYKKGHWLLGTLSGASIGRNGPALLRAGERKAAAHNLVATHAGVLGSLVFAKHPAIGFVIGYVAGEIGAHVGGL